MRSRQYLNLIMMLIVTQAVASPDDYIEFEGEHLRYGKQVWIQNCETCYAYGAAGAPVPMYPEEWQQRLEKGMPTLYEHAINGFFGTDDSKMPARGGNENLTDEQVGAAVDNMAALANFYIKRKEDTKDDK